MKYCDECAKEKEYPVFINQQLGTCDFCNRIAKLNFLNPVVARSFIDAWRNDTLPDKCYVENN